MLLSTVIDGDFEAILDRLSDVTESDQEFVIAVRYLVETRNKETLELFFENKSLVKMNDKKCVTLAAESTLEIFKMFKPMYDTTFPVETHPLISACSTGKTEIVEYIVSLIKGGKLKSPNPQQLKDFAIKVAARKGYVSILMILCKTKLHVHNAIAALVTNGNHKQIPRMLSHPEIDFSDNDFELLKLCSAYIVELMEISRHRTVYDNYARLPADYYRHAVDASKIKFEKARKEMRLKHMANVNRTTSLILTGSKSDVPKNIKPLLPLTELKRLRSKKLPEDVVVQQKQVVTSTPRIEKYSEEVNVLEHEFNKRTKRSARTGTHVDLLHDTTQKYNRSSKSKDDLKELVQGVHDYHKHDFEREMRDRKLDKFVL